MMTGELISNDKIAIVFDDMVEFYAVKNGIDALTKEGICIDLIVPLNYSDRQSLLDETYREILKHGYSPIRETDSSTTYKILLEPNPTEHYFLPEKVSYEFRIKYKYSLISAKPSPIYEAPRNIVYDAILCYTKREADILGAYTKTFLVSPMRYKGFEKNTERPHGKPILLYAPTFGHASSIDTIGEAIQALKEDYYVIVKAHHLTQYRENERNRIDILKSNSDEYYDQTADLVELLKRADVMLSDNSGSIFEALYAEVPVAVYHNDTFNKRRLGRIDTYQHQLITRGIVPHTTDIKEISGILKAAVEKRDEQRKEKGDFLEPGDVTAEFVSVLKHFLGQDRNNSEYYAMHDIIRDTHIQQAEKIESLENELALQAEKIECLESDICGLRNSKQFKLAGKLIAPYRFFARKGARC